MRMPRYFFHVKRGQVTILDQNGIELGGQQEEEEEGEQRVEEILTENAGAWRTGGPLLSRMRNGARCSNCHSRRARAIGAPPRPIVRLVLVDPEIFSRQNHRLPSIGAVGICGIDSLYSRYAYRPLTHTAVFSVSPRWRSTRWVAWFFLAPFDR